MHTLQLGSYIRIHQFYFVYMGPPGVIEGLSIEGENLQAMQENSKSAGNIISRDPITFTNKILEGRKNNGVKGAEMLSSFIGVNPSPDGSIILVANTRQKIVLNGDGKNHSVHQQIRIPNGSEVIYDTKGFNVLDANGNMLARFSIQDVQPNVDATPNGPNGLRYNANGSR